MFFKFFASKNQLLGLSISETFVEKRLIKAHKIIGLVRKLKLIIAKTVLLTIYRSFLNPHLDYGDVIYDHTFKELFQNNFEPAQCNAAFIIPGAIRGSSREKHYQELGLKSLTLRLW